MRTRLARAAAAALLLAGLACGRVLAAPREGPVRIAVLISYSGEPFGEALKGFHRHLSDAGVTAHYTTYQIKGNPENAARAAREAGREKPHLIFAVGSLAAEAVLREQPDVPLVAGMILREETVRKAANATGVYLEFGPEIQFRWLRRILPGAKTVGVLYNPAENREKIEAAARAASAQGLVLEAREVHSPRDLPTALDSLSRRADVLWGLYDTMVLTPETARPLLLFSFRNRIPLIGPSSTWVQAGALYSLEWDYEDLGKQCGEKALKVLRGEAAGGIPASSPRKTLYALNLHTAREMEIDLPESIVRSAGQIFRAEP